MYTSHIRYHSDHCQWGKLPLVAIFFCDFFPSPLKNILLFSRTFCDVLLNVIDEIKQSWHLTLKMLVGTSRFEQWVRTQCYWTKRANRCLTSNNSSNSFALTQILVIHAIMESRAVKGGLVVLVQYAINMAAIVAMWWLCTWWLQ